MPADQKLKTVVRVFYPRCFGSSISLRGEGGSLSWVSCSLGTWHEDAKVGAHWKIIIEDCNPDEKLVFKPVILGTHWANGPNFETKAGEDLDVYPFFYQKKGTIIPINGFYSSILQNVRKIFVYLPPSYYENVNKKYPVLFMNDGHNLFMSEGSFAGQHWGIGETMDELSVNQGITEHIIVGVVPVDRVWEYLPTTAQTPMGMGGGGADKYLDFLIQEVKPYVVQNFRTTVPLTKIGIAGSSYGGVISLYAWISRPEEFSLCGAFSPSVHFDNKLLFKMMEKDEHRRESSDYRFYVDSGAPGDGYPAIKEFSDNVKDKIKKGTWLNEDRFFYTYGQGHNHSERSWALRSPQALTFLLKDVKRGASM